MRTPIQEVYENFNKMSDRDFKAWMLNTDLLEKEKEVMVDFAYKCRNVMAADEFAITHWYHKTFNTKER
jgi:hypothetical protein